MKWILALCLALLPLSANATTLRPVDWDTAGFTQLGRSLNEVYVGCGGTGCAGSTFHALPLADPFVSIDLGEFQATLEIVSEVRGSVWTYGYRNLSVVAPTLTDWTLEFYFNVSAKFNAPGGPGSLADLLLATSTPSQMFLFRSATIGAGQVSSGVPTRFLRGDAVELSRTLDFGTGMGRQNQSYSDCGFSAGVATECLITLELLEVVPSVPEPSVAMLLVAGLGAFGTARSRRTRKE